MIKELNSWEEVKSYLEYILYDKRGTRALGYTSTSGYLQPFIDDVETALKEYELMKEIRITARFDLAQVNKEHKALEIIKEKRVDVDLFHTIMEDEIQSNKLWSYNYWQIDKNKLTQEEYELLKEVLL